MDDQVKVITSFGPQSLSLSFKYRRKLIDVLTTGWPPQKFLKFTDELLEKYDKQFRKVKGTYNPKPGPKKRLYDIVTKHRTRRLDREDYIDFITEFDNRVILQIRKNVLEDKLGKTDDQCRNIGNPIGKCCYICGYKINSEGGRAVSFTDKKGNLIRAQPLGSQCEHMVSVSELASLVGLYGNDYIKSILDCFKENRDSINGIPLNEYMDNWFILLLGHPKFLNRSRKYDKKYKKKDGGDYLGKGVDPRPSGCDPEGGGNREDGLLMRWAHPACNIYKDNDPWVRLDWDPNRKSEWPIVDDDVFDDTFEGPIYSSLLKLWEGTPKMGKEWRTAVLTMIGSPNLPLIEDGQLKEPSPDKRRWIDRRKDKVEELFKLATVVLDRGGQNKYLLVAQEVLRYRTIEKSKPYYEKLFKIKLEKSNYDKLINPGTSALLRGGGGGKKSLSEILLNKLTLDQLGHLLTLSDESTEKLMSKLNHKLSMNTVSDFKGYSTPQSKRLQIDRTSTLSARSSYLPDFSMIDKDGDGLISKKELLRYTIQNKDNKRWTRMWDIPEFESLTEFWESPEFQKRWIILTSNSGDQIDETIWELWRDTPTDELEEILDETFNTNPLGNLLMELVIEEGIDIRDQNTSRNPLYLLNDINIDNTIQDMGIIEGGARNKRRKTSSTTEISVKRDEYKNEYDDMLNEMIQQMEQPIDLIKKISDEAISTERIDIINSIFNPNDRITMEDKISLYRERRKASNRAIKKLTSRRGALIPEKKRKKKPCKKIKGRKKKIPCRTIRRRKKEISMLKKKRSKKQSDETNSSKRTKKNKKETTK